MNQKYKTETSSLGGYSSGEEQTTPKDTTDDLSFTTNKITMSERN